MSDRERPLRVAVFTETFLPNVDGVVTILCLMLQRLQELGHQVILFGPPGGPPTYAGAEIVATGGPRLPFYPDLRFNVARYATWQKVRRFRPDIIHAVNPVLLGPFGMAFAGRLHTPILASFHTHLPRYVAHYGAPPLTPLVWRYLRGLHNRAAVTLCSSSTLRSELRAHGFRRVRWWRRGVDTSLFAPGPVDPAVRALLTDGHPDQFLVINVGRQAPEKQLERLADSLFHGSGVRLALIGAGPSHAHLKQRFAGTPTVLPGFLRGQELVAAYRAADAFILPSTTETFGLVALEAMACGLPVIAARAGGVLDTVVDGRNGFLYDPDEPGQIRPLVDRLRQHADLRQRMREEAIRHAQRRSWRDTMDQLVEYYRRAIRVHRLSRPGSQASGPTG